MASAAVIASAGVKAAEWRTIVTLGPESAKALGVPVGTEIDYGVVAFWHSNPLIRLARKLRPNAPAKADVELARRHQEYARAEVEAA